MAGGALKKYHANNIGVLSGLLGLAESDVSDLAAKNIIPPPIAGEYNLFKCVQFYVAHLHATTIPRTGTAAEVGEFLAMSGPGIHRLVRETEFPRLARGEYDIKACTAWYSEHLRRRAYDKDSGGEISTERMLLIREQRLRAQQEREAQAREWVRRQECEEGWITLTSLMVSGLDSFVARVATTVTNAESPAEAREILKREGNRIRAELARKLAELSKSVRPIGRDDSQSATRPEG